MARLEGSTRLSSAAVRTAALSLLVFGILLAPVLEPQGVDGGAQIRYQDGRWIVTSVDRGSLADAAGLRVGDEIVALDGRPPEDFHRTEPGVELGRTTEWKVRRGDEALTIDPRYELARWHEVDQPLFLLAIALAFWGIATFVRLSKPEAGLARQFYRLNVAAALVLALNGMASRDVPWAKIVEVIAFADLPALFLSFFLWFSRDAPPAALGALAVRFLHAAGVALGLLYLTLGFLRSNWYDTARAALLALLAVGLLGGLAALVQAYRHPSSPDTRGQVGIVGLGAAAAVLPLTAFSLIPESLGRSPIIDPRLAALSTMLLPVAFAYAVLRGRFLGVDAVERTLVYGVMAVLLAGGYSLLFYGLSIMGPSKGVDRNPVLVLIFSALVTLTFVPAHDRVQRVIDHLLYRDRYDYVTTLRSLAAQLASLRPIDEVLSAVVSSLAAAMSLRGAAVLLREPGGGLVVRSACGELRDEALCQSLLDGAPSRSPEEDGRPSPYHFIPLVAQGEESGFICLGPKSTRAGLSAEDVSLAETIAAQTAAAVANALLVERLQAKVLELELLKERLLRVEEEERKRLARDIHDGPLHTVLDLVRRAEATAGLPTCSRVLDDQLYSLGERGRDAIHELRTLCAELYPSELDHLGLAPALESLVRQVNRDEAVVVRLTLRDFPPDYRMSSEAEETLYRVAREALDNVCRHSGASEASVDLAMNVVEVVMTIRDNGQGFVVPASPATLLRRGHLGLASMRERVEGLGGDCVIRSLPGTGAEVSVRMPLAGASDSLHLLPDEVGS